MVGPNGSGKSTLLKALYRALPVAHGRVLVGDRDLRGMRPRDSARVVAALTQDPGDDGALDVREVVATGLTPHKGALDRDTAEDREARRRLPRAHGRDGPRRPLRPVAVRRRAPAGDARGGARAAPAHPGARRAHQPPRRGDAARGSWTSSGDSASRWSWPCTTSTSRRRTATGSTWCSPAASWPAAHPTRCCSRASSATSSASTRTWGAPVSGRRHLFFSSPQPTTIPDGRP
ncbi:ABC transporter ATP-binding protein [Clavibacter tessellarius]